MKKFYLIVAVLAVLVPTTSWAKKNMYLSVKAGINLANMSSDETPEPDRSIKVGGIGGVGITVAVSDLVGVRAEVLFSQKGFAYSANVPFLGNIDGSLAVNYLDIPITAALMFSGKRVQPFIFAGPVIGLKMGDPVATINGVSGDVKGNFKSTDFGFTIGAGLNFPLGKNAFGIDARYTLGLSSINEESSPIVKNNVISIMSSYSFSI